MKNLAAIEKIKNFSNIGRILFSAENNMLTPTLKMKRYIIKKISKKILFGSPATINIGL